MPSRLRADRTLRLWDLESGQTLRTLEGHTGWVSAVAVTPDGRRAVSASGTKRCGSGTWRAAKRSARSKVIPNSVSAVAVTPDGRRAVSASADQTLRLWDLESGQTIRTLEGHTDSVSAVAVTPDGRRAVSASGDRTLRLWDLESGQTIRTLEGHTDCGQRRGGDARRSPCGLGSVTERCGSGTWRAAKRIRTLEGHTDSVSAVAVTPDGRRAVSALGGPNAAALGPGERPNDPHARRPYGLGQCRGGHARWPPCRLGLGDKTLRLWDLESGQTLRTLEGHTDWVNAVAVTPDGRRAVSGSEDRTLRLWDLESGQTLHTLEAIPARSMPWRSRPTVAAPSRLG